MQVLANAQHSEQLAERACQLERQNEEAHAQCTALQRELVDERSVAGGLRRELQALATASRGHLKEFGELADALDAVSQVRYSLCTRHSTHTNRVYSQSCQPCKSVTAMVMGVRNDCSCGIDTVMVVPVVLRLSFHADTDRM